MLVQLRQLKFNVILMMYSLNYNNNIFTHIILLLLTIVQGIHLNRHVHFMNMIILHELISLYMGIPVQRVVS